MVSPSFSVVIPYYNGHDFIKRALDSVEIQNFNFNEVLIIDDCSEHESYEFLIDIIKLYQLNIKVIELSENGGPSVARNKGIENATGDYIAFLDCDDQWSKDKMSVIVQSIHENPNVVLIGHASTQWIEGDVIAHNQDYEIQKVKKFNTLFSNPFNTTSSVVLRRTNDLIFDTNMKYCEDQKLWMQIIFSNHLVLKVSAPLSYYFKTSFGESGLSKNLYLMEKGELNNIYNLYRNNNISFLLFIMSSSISILKYLYRIAFTKFKNMFR